MEEDKIVVTRDVLRAIGADTRINILKALEKRQKTQSELASELKLTAPTILEHLDRLAEADLVERIDEGRKWKYYRLTNTGRKLIGKSAVNVVMLLGFSLMLALAAFLLIVQKTSFLFSPPQYSAQIEKSNENIMQVQAPEVQTSQKAMQPQPEMDRATTESAGSSAPTTTENGGVGAPAATSIDTSITTSSTAPASDGLTSCNNAENQTIGCVGDEATETSIQKVAQSAQPLQTLNIRSILPEFVIFVVSIIVVGVSVGYLMKK